MSRLWRRMDNPTECASPPIPPNKIVCPRFTFMEEEGESAVSIHPTFTTTSGAWSEQVTGEKESIEANRSPVQARAAWIDIYWVNADLTAEDRLPPYRSVRSQWRRLIFCPKVYNEPSICCLYF